MVLFYGCWGPEEQIYQEEMENAISENVLTSYHVAYSRMADSPKVQQSASVVSNTHRIVIIDYWPSLLPILQRYVQDQIRQKKEAVVNLIANRGGHVYICGDVKMAADVCKTLDDILSSSNRIGSDQIDTLKVRERERDFGGGSCDQHREWSHLTCLCIAVVEGGTIPWRHLWSLHHNHQIQMSPADLLFTSKPVTTISINSSSLPHFYLFPVPFIFNLLHIFFTSFIPKQHHKYYLFARCFKTFYYRSYTFLHIYEAREYKFTIHIRLPATTIHVADAINSPRFVSPAAYVIQFDHTVAWSNPEDKMLCSRFFSGAHEKLKNYHLIWFPSTC